MSDYEPIPKQLLNQEARCERCEELCNAFDMIRCACGTFRCAKCSLKKCDCQGFHDGSCHARRIAELEQQVKDLEARMENMKEHYTIAVRGLVGLFNTLKA